ncbi:unnamed protein product [Paramecium sonneborni]|uniref:Uncharacterized protein n=1 Tax=Paramecium sonneborni TaxID=65129 RepID=A0A8S1QY66_9CILI|nr:unnamed protein product [Paramecium sonneborni]
MYVPFINENQRIQKSIYKDKICLAIAISQDNRLIYSGCDEKILVHMFKQGIVKQLKYLNQHAAEISTLNICRKNHNIVSGSLEGSIVIQPYSLIASSKYIQKLKGHDDIMCLAISPIMEDFLVTGSRDNQIKLWSSINQQYSCSQTIIDHNNCVCGLSINQSENQIISCSLDQMILILEKIKTINQQTGFYYKKSMLINLGIDYVVQIIQFLFFNPIHTKIKNYKQFVKSSEFSIKNEGNACYYFFPSQFNLKKNILIIKNKNNINVIKVQLSTSQNIQLNLNQIIGFGDNCIFGTLSFDGEYLITWDENSRQIQIRKYQEMQQIN